jgi:hypothetical protein
VIRGTLISSGKDRSNNERPGLRGILTFEKCCSKIDADVTVPAILANVLDPFWDILSFEFFQTKELSIATSKSNNYYWNAK